MAEVKDALIADLRGQIRSCRCPAPVLPNDNTIGACVDSGNCGCLHKEAASNGPATDISTVAGQCAMLSLSNTALLSERDELREALSRIAGIEPEPFAFPSDWHEQIEACEECQRYKNHPIQQGICDKHRRPLWDREKHDRHQEVALGYRAQRIARDALAAARALAGKGVKG